MVMGDSYHVMQTREGLEEIFGRLALLQEQVWQKSFPHFRQWCFKKRNKD